MFLTLFNSLPNDKILDLSKLKALADNKINVTEKLKIIFGTVENIVKKGESVFFFSHYVSKRLLCLAR